MIRRLLTAVTLAVLAGCSGNSPAAPDGGGGPPGGGGGDPPPSTAAVTVGNDFFKSGQDGTSNPAVTTVAVGGTVTWTWTGTGSTAHSVQSQGSPGFTSSAIQTGEGKTYQVTFSAAGTYQYNCAVHGAAMSGRIVVR
ncbi:MAG TPA: plastocyanin/azurin family copper-binding protein [Gemmatimonadales bacterium]|nr:plastocyanin/azurin family copper-binding protein [Gemmatimonadales bacterium]